MTPIRTLPCGCWTCGCACAEHAGDPTDPLCRRHVAAGMAQAAMRELVSAVAIALFLGCVAVWAAIICGA